MKIAIGNDHSAVDLREEITKHLRERGFEVEEVGTFSRESSNYPEWGEKVCRKVLAKEADLGIAICGTGVGISIACNKVKGIRAVCCSEPYSARLSRQHNNANVLCFGARVVGAELAKMIVDEWLDAEFQGGRHQTRIDMITEIENKG
jgi:ribose 5-phosphate isomerase B